MILLNHRGLLKDSKSCKSEPMNSLPSKTTLHLIQSLESGDIDHTEAARQIARIHTAKSENYAQILIIGIVLAGFSWSLTGGSVIIPIAIGIMTWETYSNQRRERLEAFKHIAQGQILEYLPDADREVFESLLTEKPTEQGLQNPDDQAMPRSEPETQTQKGIHRQLLNIECGDVAQVIAHDLKPLIISARPRTGKGILTAHAIAHAKQLHGASVWVIQPKPAPHELGYWKQADRFLGFYVEENEVDDPAIAEKLTTFVREWRANPHRPTILLIDELANLKAMQPTWYKEFFLPQCVVEGSSGETDKRVLWLLTVSPLIGDLGLSGGNRSTFDILTLQTVASRDHRASFKKSVESLEALPTDDDFKKSPVGTLVFHSAIGLWAAVPSYPVPKILPGDRLCPEIRALVQPGSNFGSNSEPGLNPVQHSEPGSNLGSTREPYTQRALSPNSSDTVHGSVQPGSEFEPMPNRARVVVELNRRGMGQTEIIELIWGVKKGGTKGYQIALEEYRAIVAEHNI
jgi:hypothetical protein